MYFSNRELDAFASMEGEKSRQPLFIPMFPDWVDVPSVCKLIKLTKRNYGKETKKRKEYTVTFFKLKCRREVFLGGYNDLFSQISFSSCFGELSVVLAV